MFPQHGHVSALALRSSHVLNVALIWAGRLPPNKDRLSNNNNYTALLLGSTCISFHLIEPLGERI